MCNCLVFALWMRFRWGGSIRWHRSRTWLGFHNTWVSPNGKVLEYTLTKPRRQPWWYIPICYRGVVKKVCRKTELLYEVKRKVVRTGGAVPPQVHHKHFK